MSEFPLWASVDVLVLGGSVAGVSAAVAAAGAGARVAVLAERTYVGDDVAGTFELWPGASPRHPLARAIWPDGLPCSPLHAKSVLEQALLAAGCQYLVGTGLTHVLRDEEGQVAGALVSTSGGLIAVAAHVVLDATRHGLALQAAGYSAVEHGPFTAAMVVVGDRPSQGSSLGLIQASSRWTGRREAPVWRALVSANVGAGTPRDWGRVDADVRRLVFTPGQLRTADLLSFPEAPVRLSHWVASRLARAPGDGNAPVERFRTGEALGLRAAQIAASSAPGRPVQAVCAGGVTGSGLRWVPAPGRFDGLPRIRLEGTDCWPVLGQWDVGVLGGGTSGAPAGLAAVRGGARCLVAEAAPGLGGVGTQGMIGSYFAGNRVGFTSVIDRGVAGMGPPSSPPRPEGQWNVEWKAAWYLRELRVAGADVWLGARAAGVRVENGQLSGFAVTTPWGAGLVEATVSVDASGSATLAAAAGAPVSVVGSDHVAVQGSGLGPRELAAHNRNTDWTFVDDGDPGDQTRAFMAARSKWKGEFDVAQIVDMRERRRILAEYDLDILDILAGRTFPDTIALARAPYETHGFTIHPLFMALPPPPKEDLIVSPIPLRSLLPRGVEGLLVVGLGLGAHRDALPVICMQADVQNIGWAAGLGAWWAAQHGAGRVRSVPVRDLQRALVEGGSIPAELLRQEDSFPVSYDDLALAVASGPATHRSLALVFSDPQKSIPIMRSALRVTQEPVRRERLAVVLGLLGDESAADALAGLVAGHPWDAGWNFAGMEQWGHSLSRMDTLLIALGRTGARRHAGVVASKLVALGAEAPLSHARAVALASAGLGDPALGLEVQRLLAVPGGAGHHQKCLAEVARESDQDPHANRDRNVALRELFLARALWQLGDIAGLAEQILMDYTGDLRGHFSRHAAAVLASPAGAAMTWTREQRLRMA